MRNAMVIEYTRSNNDSRMSGTSIGRIMANGDHHHKKRAGSGTTNVSKDPNTGGITTRSSRKTAKKAKKK
jgi:hypothetical protein